jgi:AAA+ superfamily predicted ATPase
MIPLPRSNTSQTSSHAPATAAAVQATRTAAPGAQAVGNVHPTSKLPSAPPRNVLPRAAGAQNTKSLGELATIKEVQDEFDVLIRARYPAIFIVSSEEARLERYIQSIATLRKKELFTWSVVSGIRKAGSVVTGSVNYQDPIEALDQVLENKEPSIYIFYDLHQYINGCCPANRPVIRKVREVSKALADSYKTLIISAPRSDFHPDLEKDLTVLDLPLPGAVELHSLLDKIESDVEGHPTLRVNLDTSGRNSLVQAASGLTIQEAENVLAKTLVIDGVLCGNDVRGVFTEKQQIVRKSGILEYFASSTDLSDLGGLETLKGWLRKRASAFSQSAREFGLPCPKGVLLVGVQGCGKSLCAKAISSEWNMPLLRFDMGKMFSSFIGSSESNIRRAISVAESIAPVVLWVDEIDKAFAGTQSSGRTDGGTAARVVSTFLTWLNEKTAPVFVMATANDISQLPPELLRKGRLDEIFFVDLPTLEERATIFMIHLTRRKRDAASFDCAQLAAASEGFSGAEIEQAIVSAMYDAFEEGSDVTTPHILTAVTETVPLSKTMVERIDELRGWASGRARYAGKEPTSAMHDPQQSNASRRFSHITAQSPASTEGA